jgi:hypothetical protein
MVRLSVLASCSGLFGQLHWKADGNGLGVAPNAHIRILHCLDLSYILNAAGVQYRSR